MIEKKKEKQHIPAATAFPFGGNNQNNLRIVFMGTPEFAVTSLDKLVKAGYNIVAVITAPDKAAGRGMELQQSAIKKYAVEQGLFVLQPEKLKDEIFIKSLKALNADLQVVVAFRMLPEVVWNMPPLGTINVHGSLLPQYRGAAPINWAIIHGEKFTGVTTFKLQHEIDTGNILLTHKIEIGEDETAGELHDKMKEAGADLLLQTVMGIVNGSLVETPQNQTSYITNDSSLTLNKAPKIFTETCKIDWQKSTEEIYNLVRGLSPYPGAFTIFQNKKLKIFKASKVYSASPIGTGKFETDEKTYLQFSCSDGFLNVKELQIEGKKRMEVGEFLRGYRFLIL